MGFFKVFGWIFGVRRRYAWEIRRYEKGGLGRRVFAIILSLFFLGATAGLEYWFNLHFMGVLVSEANLVVTILIGVIAVAVMLATIERCIVFTWVGFANFSFNGVSDKLLDKQRKKDMQKAEEIPEADGVVVEETKIETEEAVKKRKKLKWWDLSVAVFQLLIIVGVVLVTFFLLKDLWLWLMSK